MLKAGFNQEIPRVIHVDINSCFATIEQQANPFLRGKPVAVAAFTTPGGCILASSIEAKRLGIKTGMRVKEGHEIFANLVVLSPDPNKYREVHKKLKGILERYSPDVFPKSIDEFVLELQDSRTPENQAKEIKQKIKKEIGEWITVSIGISTNRYLAKIAAGLKKPDGLTEINKDNFLGVYKDMKLTDLTGIKDRNAARLNLLGIYSVLDFYNHNKPVLGSWWNLRLRGYEVDDFKSKRVMFGNSVALGTNLSSVSELAPILARLTEKMCGRLRAAGYRANGCHLMIVYKDGSWYGKGRLVSDLYKGAFRLLLEASPQSPVLNIAVSCYDLERKDNLQLSFFDDVERKENLTDAVDTINRRWGDFTISNARSLGGAKVVLDRISFGGVKDLMSQGHPL